MLDIIIRLAATSERSSLERLQWRASLSNPGDHVVVAERQRVIVGFATVLPRPDGEAELDALFVEPALWKGGIGRLLVEHCAGVARRRSSRILHVVGNPH